MTLRSSSPIANRERTAPTGCGMFGLIDLRVQQRGQKRPNRLEDAAKQRVTALNGRLLEEREGLSVNNDRWLDLRRSHPLALARRHAGPRSSATPPAGWPRLSGGDLAHLETFDVDALPLGEPARGEIGRDHIHARPVCCRHHRNEAAHEPVQ